AFIGAGREEGELTSVGAPARGAFAILAEGELALLLAVPPGEPDVGDVLVLFHVHGADGVSDPLAAGRTLGIGDGAELIQVVAAQRTFRSGRSGRGVLRATGGHGQQQEREYRSHRATRITFPL